MDTNSKPTVLAIIPARGGSKGLPHKNVLEIGGKPLIAWTIEAAQKASCITRVILSSDDDEIMTVARAYGCEVPFQRPEKLACDHSTTLDVVLHAISQIPGYDYVMVLQPTSPLRTAQHIEAAFEAMIASDAPSCTSVCEVEKTPYWMFHIADHGRLKRLLDLPENAHRRQDLPPAYSLNGAIYITSTEALLKTQSFVTDNTIAYPMHRDVSGDIDTQSDFKSIQTYLNEDTHAKIP